MKQPGDALYMTFFLLLAVMLFIVGRNQLPISTLATWGVVFGTTTAAAVLMLSLYRVQGELKKSRHELARRNAELNFALEVQKALFPRRLPSNGDLQFSAVCIPAQGISGDYYDILELSDGNLVFAIADISGKGISAAIVMANIQALLRILVERGDPLSEVCTGLNFRLYQVTDPSRFATFFLARWHSAERRLEYVNAGHQIPILLGSGTHRPLEEGGPPVGLFEETKYRGGEVSLQPGDLMVLYSDGISEAMTSDGREFGEHRLLKLVELHRDAELDAIQKTVLSAVEGWAGKDPADDITLLLVRACRANERK